MQVLSATRAHPQQEWYCVDRQPVCLLRHEHTEAFRIKLLRKKGERLAIQPMCYLIGHLSTQSLVCRSGGGGQLVDSCVPDAQQPLSLAIREGLEVYLEGLRSLNKLFEFVCIIECNRLCCRSYAFPQFNHICMRGKERSGECEDE